MSDPGALDRIVTWCSVVGSGSRPRFDRACEGLLSGAESASETLARLELMGVVDVDWERSKWATAPTCLTLVQGSGGNARVTGARTPGTWKALELMHVSGTVASLTSVVSDPGYPSSWFVGIRDGSDLTAIADALGVQAVNDAPSLQLAHYVPLAEIVAASTARFVPSGFQARQFDPVRLRFVDVDVTRDSWPVGCFEQRSRGRNQYLFIDDVGTRHVLDRWVAVHAELRRARGAGISVPDVLVWDQNTERLANLAAARLPSQWARMAVSCTGLAPRRSTAGAWTDVYEGVTPRVFKRIAEALQIPFAGDDLSRFDEETR